MTDFLSFAVWVFDTLVLQILPVVVLLLIAFYIYKCGLTGMDTLREWFSKMFSGLYNMRR